jgi:hypothetical protein
MLIKGKRLQKLFYLFLCFMLLSPGLSLSYLLFHIYFPNDKLGGIIAILYLISKKISRVDARSFVAILLCVAAMFMVYFMRFIGSGLLFTKSDLNLVVTYLLLVPYITVFLRNPTVFSSSLANFILVDCLWALMQNILINVGRADIPKMLLTYPTQVGGYSFEAWFPYLYRVPGFSLESSQFAVLLVLYLGLTHKFAIFKNGEKYRGLIIFTILINGSTAGYLAMIILGIFSKKKNFLVDASLIGLIGTLILFFVPAQLYTTISNVSFGKIVTLYNAFQGDFEHQVGMDRITSFMTAFSNFNEYPLLGKGLAYYDGHDFFSLMIIGNGVIGGVIFICFYGYLSGFLDKRKVVLTMIICSYFISNGSMLDAIYTWYLVISVVVTRITKISTSIGGGHRLLWKTTGADAPFVLNSR